MCIRDRGRRGIDKECASVVTQMVVSEDDPAFQKPTKPVGSFYSKEDADKIVAEKGYTFVEDAGRGWRRVVPSPLPTRIVELKVVEQLVAAGDVVITVGGGGIPVVAVSYTHLHMRTQGQHPARTARKSQAQTRPPRPRKAGGTSFCCTSRLS